MERFVWKVVVLTLCVSAARSCGLTDGFGEQAARLVASLRLPEDQLRKIPLVLQHTELALSSRWPGIRLFPFGSTFSGLAIQHSDVDVFARLPNHTDGDAAFALKVVPAKSVLEQYPGLFSHLTVIDNVNVPILSFKHIPTGFDVDVNFKTSEGSKNSELLRYFLNLDECVLHLTVLVKYWGKLHRITEHATYGMNFLVISYLQQKDILPPVNLLMKNAKPHFVENWNMGFDEIPYESRYEGSLYTLMGGFFEYYDSFDFAEYMVSPFVGRPVKRQLFKDLQSVPDVFSLYRHNVASNITKPFNLSRTVCIQDPFFHNKNVGKNLDASLGSRFRAQLKRAALEYRKNNSSTFLGQILSAD